MRLFGLTVDKLCEVDGGEKGTRPRMGGIYDTLSLFRLGLL
jgi:hypothetical protein